MAHRIIALSGDVEENPWSFTQINNDKIAPCANTSVQFHYWNPHYLNLVEFQAMHWEMRTVFSVRSHASDITSLRIICMYAFLELEFSMFSIILSYI